MKRIKDQSGRRATPLAPASVVDDEGLEGLKRRAERLGLIIHQQTKRGTKSEREKRDNRRKRA